MTTLTAKQREIQERESRILEVARKMVVREGYHGLNMDRIADAVKYSKGTIYNHFSCKEEIIIALAAQISSKRVELFQKAAQYRGCSRYRMMAIGQAAEIFVRDYPDFFEFEEIIQLSSVQEKTSEKRKIVIQGCEMQCMSVVAGIVRDAVAQEDLILQDGITPEKLVFGLWSLTSGAYSIMLKSKSLMHFGFDDPFQLVQQHTSFMLDGFGWNPISTEYEADEVVEKIRKELFATT